MLLHKSVVHDSRVRREARALGDAGHEVTVVELDRDARATLDGFRRVSAAPAPWVRARLPFQLYRIVFLAGFLRRTLELRPDVVHAHDAAMLLPGLLGARVTGARLVYDSHELATGVPYRDGAWARFVRLIERVAVPRADAVITVSDGIARRLQELYRLRRRPTVVRNVTDLTPPPAPTGLLRRRLGIDDAPVVLHQGAPAPDRGGEQLIAAMPAVPGAHLVFLGSSPFPGYEAGLRRLANAEGVDDRVHFLPSVPLDRLLDYTADADVGVSLLQDTCDNHRLALPNKVFEYMAAGVPVVVSDLPEVAALVAAEDYGWAVEQRDRHAIAEGLRRALSLPRGTGLIGRAPVPGWISERAKLESLYARIQAGDAINGP